MLRNLSLFTLRNLSPFPLFQQRSSRWIQGNLFL
jgi:hypothetical protein